LSYDFLCRLGEDGTAARRPTPSHSGEGRIGTTLVI
jgi:hypothetical protein